MRILLRKARSLVRRVRARFAPPEPEASIEAATIDLASPRVARNPFPHYETLRGAGPVQYLVRHGFWIVLGYAEAQAAFAQPQVFSNAPYADVDAVLLGADPPRHAEVRRLIVQYFSGATLQHLAALAEATAARLVRPRLDVVNGYGAPLSRAVAGALIGFDDDAVASILAAHEASLRTPAPLATFIASLDRIAEHATLYQHLTRDGRGALGDAEVRSLIRLLWLAATMTTERTITQSVLGLLQHPEVRREIEHDPALVPPYVEEILRLHPPEHMVPRLTTQEVELGGVRIPAGALVQLCASAANRDPLQFEDPQSLRINRPSNRHLAFGSGVHRCVGAALTRSVIDVAMRTLLGKLPGLRALEPLESIRWFQTPSALTPERLEIGA